MYDLRSDTEIEKYNTPLPVIEGVDVIHVPVFKKEDYSPEMMAQCAHMFTLLKPNNLITRTQAVPALCQWES